MNDWTDPTRADEARERIAEDRDLRAMDMLARYLQAGVQFQRALATLGPVRHPHLGWDPRENIEDAVQGWVDELHVSLAAFRSEPLCVEDGE